MVILELDVEDEMELRLALSSQIREYERVVSICEDQSYKDFYASALERLKRMYTTIGGVL